jgi:ATP-dependent RNA helicase DDX23/PRP28
LTFSIDQKPSQPKFLSKEERAKLAIAKRAQEIREEKDRTEASRRDRQALESQAEELAQQRDRNTKYNGGGRC